MMAKNLINQMRITICLYLNTTYPHQDGSTCTGTGDNNLKSKRRRWRALEERVKDAIKGEHLGGSEGSFLRGLGLRVVNHSDDVDQ